MLITVLTQQSFLKTQSQAWSCMPVIPELRRHGQSNSSLGYRKNEHWIVGCSVGYLENSMLVGLVSSLSGMPRRTRLPPKISVFVSEQLTGQFQ